MPDLHADPFDALPSGLPPGRLVVPDDDFTDGEWTGGAVLWVSDEPTPDAARHWLRLFEIRDKTGLYPLLLETLKGEPTRPWHDGELDVPAPVGSIDVLTAVGVLRRFWESVTEELPGDAGEDEQVDDSGVPRGPWPGLAPPGEPGRDPDAVAREYVQARYTGEKLLLGLVPAARGADTLARTGWQGPANHTGDVQEISAVVRSWEDRFGARVVAVGFATLDLSVAAPPATADQALGVAAEHHAFCPDNVWQNSDGFTEYAGRLIGAGNWSFWWD
ncbi:protein of unknown function [Thermomonospora echinospora]|uniref:DUF4253 domain-containing protein n=1 Tax=Thermomonospora echinospora TaxID=1992 RepID=A0A1H5VJI5_9ACTN|nr:DUF4253 domain-containing protein [Thermomonospora echinospora]SEF87469.1 protein of unknown function [Thermomonospora echinospora]